MQTLVIIFTIFTISCAFPNAYDDNEDIDHIVGGHKANSYSYNFLTALLRDGECFCGGSLVTANHILTAAHCVDYIKPKDYGLIQLLLNTSTLNPPDNGAIHRGVKKIVHHRNYNSATSVNDIAIITLDSPVENIKPIPLPRIGSTLSYSGMWATVIGFGRTLKTLAEDESSGNGSNKLMESSLQVISNSNCSKMYSESKETKISASMLCAYAAGTDTCQGDSGGPLIVEGTQIGIVSWGYGCADPKYAGVYTRLTFFYTWIRFNLV
ncbi:hypothetical protein DAPPUDRAFT_228481 [Daphnia pulex]|uniref:Peptidase S1 domain-containing protein n=2 Tax=Daphnia pulex TaxID=6669 RepID=E9HE37_DAPPU|nr:hypothetical protein DAPPUDRAFT_228481 [Daphnia pulex]|eukprot:EFX69999.1 hypothetical protein DAPPUDRAFT_228481 [Daphnia pulex]